MIPVDFHFPPKLLYIEKAPNGNYNKTIDNIASTIIEIINKNDLRVWFKSTDGDRYLSNDHEVFFNKYVNGKSSNFMKLVSQIYLELEKDPDLHIPVGDPLHLWKGMRSKYQTNIISLFSDSEASTDIESAKAILEIGKALDDYSST